MPLVFFDSVLIVFSSLPFQSTRHALSLFCFALGLVSKQIAATLPAAALGLDYIFLCGFDGQKLKERKLYPGYLMAQVEYKCTDFYDKADEIGARWDSAGISWPLREPLLSQKDAALPSLDELLRSLS